MGQRNTTGAEDAASLCRGGRGRPAPDHGPAAGGRVGTPYVASPSSTPARAVAGGARAGVPRTSPVEASQRCSQLGSAIHSSLWLRIPDRGWRLRARRPRTRAGVGGSRRFRPSSASPILMGIHVPVRGRRAGCLFADGFGVHREPVRPLSSLRTRGRGLRQV